MKYYHVVENKNVPEHRVKEVTKNFDSDRYIIAQKSSFPICFSLQYCQIQ